MFGIGTFVRMVTSVCRVNSPTFDSECKCKTTFQLETNRKQRYFFVGPNLISNIPLFLCQLVLCSVLTGEVKTIAQVSFTCGDKKVSSTKLAADEALTSSDDVDELLAIRCTNSHLVTWSTKQWFIYSLDGAVVARGVASTPEVAILLVEFTDDVSNTDDLFMITSTEGNKTIWLELKSRNQKTAKKLQLRDVAALSRDRHTVFTRAPSVDDRDIICYSTPDVMTSPWSMVAKATLANSDELYGLVLSADEGFIIGITQNTFKRWHTATKRLVVLRLPRGVRNFPR